MNEQQILKISALGKKLSDATILIHETIAQKAGLSATDHKYLGFLIQNGAISAGDFAKLTNLTTGAVTGLIDRLEKKALVKRQFDKEDRRKIIIAPNLEKIKKTFGSTQTAFKTAIINHVSAFSDGEIEIIEKYLTSTIELMDTLTNKFKNN
jgi:DNA-binding MarR family transcriptional regulator